jgi:hypothetical protein
MKQEFKMKDFLKISKYSSLENNRASKIALVKINQEK